MNETQIDKKVQREANRIYWNQQRKWAVELINGTVLRNAALEQLGCKMKEVEISTVSAKAQVEEAATWAVKCAEQKQQYPRAILYALPSQLPRLSKWKSKWIVTSATATRRSCAL